MKSKVAFAVDTRLRQTSWDIRSMASSMEPWQAYNGLMLWAVWKFTRLGDVSSGEIPEAKYKEFKKEAATELTSLTGHPDRLACLEASTSLYRNLRFSGPKVNRAGSSEYPCILLK